MRRYFTSRCIGMHLTLLVVLPVFSWLTWWQLSRALAGNTLSWAYTFEWPLFAGYAVFVWWQLIHDEPTVLNRVRSGNPSRPEDEVGWALKKANSDQPTIEIIDDEPQPDEEDPELAEYNRYLAELNAAPDQRHW